MIYGTTYKLVVPMTNRLSDDVMMALAILHHLLNGKIEIAQREFPPDDGNYFAALGFLDQDMVDKEKAFPNTGSNSVSRLVWAKYGPHISHFDKETMSDVEVHFISVFTNARDTFEQKFGKVTSGLEHEFDAIKILSNELSTFVRSAKVAKQRILKQLSQIPLGE